MPQGSDPESVVGKYHLGADLNLGSCDADKGKSVQSIADGKIVKVVDVLEEPNNWGNVVFIEHDLPGGTYTSVYAHVDWMSGGKPKPGDVSRGDPIAVVSNGNGVWPYHLHFEIREGRSVVRGPGYTATKVSKGPQGQIDPIRFIVDNNGTETANGSSVSDSLSGAPEYDTHPGGCYSYYCGPGTSLTARMATKLYANPPSKVGNLKGEGAAIQIKKGQGATVEETIWVSRGVKVSTKLEQTFYAYPTHYAEGCFIWRSGQLQNNKAVCDAARKELGGAWPEESYEIWAQLVADAGGQGWVLIGTSVYKNSFSELAWANPDIFDEIIRVLIINAYDGFSYGEAVEQNKVLSSSERVDLIKAISGVLAEGADLNQANSDHSVSAAALLPHTQDIVLADALIELGMDIKDPYVCSSLLSALAARTGFSYKSESFRSLFEGLLERGLSAQCPSRTLPGYTASPISFLVGSLVSRSRTDEQFDVAKALELSRVLIRYGDSPNVVQEGRSASTILLDAQRKGDRVAGEMLAGLRQIEIEENQRRKQIEIQRIASLRTDAEIASIVDWDSSLSSKAPWTNTADLLRHDPAKTTSILSDGHKIIFEVKTIEFSNGSVVVNGEQAFTDIYAGIEKSAVQKVQDDFSWDGWFAAVSEVGSDGGPRGYYYACRVPPKQASSLKEGSLYIFTAKLISLAKNNAVFDCKLEGPA